MPIVDVVSALRAIRSLWLCCACSSIWMLAPLPALSAMPSAAFYYGPDVPWEELRLFDMVVVDAEHGRHPPKRLTQRTDIFAYVSLGEFHPSRGYAKQIPREWVLGENHAWAAHVVDQSQPEWPAFVAERMVRPLWEQGYRGLFLDTLDSYHLVAHDDVSRERQEQGLIRVIQHLRATFPGLQLIFNRGFEIIPAVHEHVHAVAAESLFRGWNQAKGKYVAVPDDDRAWLLGQLQALQAQYDVPVIVIDYVPPQEREAARAVAKKIKALGMVPWVSTPSLDHLGVGRIEVMPRKVLALFDGTRDPDAAHSDIHRYIDMPLQYLGYVPEHWDVTQALPAYPIAGRYAGIVLWVPGGKRAWSESLHAWLVTQMRAGVRVVMLNALGFPLTSPMLEPFGMSMANRPSASSKLQITRRDERIGHEIQPFPSRRNFLPLTAPADSDVWLRLETKDGKHQDAIAVTPWGGYAVAPYVLMQLPSLTAFRWVFDPIEFLREGLQLPSMPVPDPTTENGRRLLMAHVDGDGFASLAEFPGERYAGEVMYEEVLKRYPIPTTVSIIEGEIAETGLYPALSSRLEPTARQIFALNHVEVASHSFSHPFFWRDFVAKGSTQPGHYHLNVPAYSYGPESLAREISGSLAYIQTRLAPKDKPPKVFLWTGDCDPGPDALAEAYAAGVGNMNGGDTIMTEQNKTLSAVAPLGVRKGAHYQIYAPNQNENMYTNEWTGPFYGFEQVIETFSLTDRPRRLKPIDIYYHTYSASKKAALHALHTVYQWALTQPTHPVFVSEYIQKVQDFNRIVIAKAGDAWRIEGTQHLKELRIPRTMGYPNLRQSRGVTGFSDHERVRYVHLGNDDRATIVLQTVAPTQPHLVESNGRIVKWAAGPRRVHFTVHSHLPATTLVANVRQCMPLSKEIRVSNRREKERLSLSVRQQRGTAISFTCIPGK